MVGIKFEALCARLFVAVPVRWRAPALDEFPAREGVHVVADLGAVGANVTRVLGGPRWTCRRRRRRRGR